MAHSMLPLASLPLLAAPGSAPSLFFNEGDLVALRERVRSKAYARIWEQILGDARKMSDPESSGHADPNEIDAGGYKRIAIRAHAYGRRLTNWAETLGFAYQLTGDETFGKHGARILVAAAAKLPVRTRFISRGSGGL